MWFTRTCIRNTTVNLAVSCSFLLWLGQVAQQIPQMKSFTMITSTDLTLEDSIKRFEYTVGLLYILAPHFHQMFRNGFEALRPRFYSWNSSACKAVYQNSWHQLGKPLQIRKSNMKCCSLQTKWFAGAIYTHKIKSWVDVILKSRFYLHKTAHKCYF